MKRKSNSNEVDTHLIECSHCGTEYSSEMKYCPNCSEATAVSEAKQRITKRERKVLKNAWLWETIKLFVVSGIFSLAVSLIMGATEILTQEKILGFRLWFVIFFTISLIFTTLISIDRHKNAEWKKRMAQFHADETSICPNCGSHDLSFGRKGYDWNYAFWGSIFRLRGSQYIAGMDSRRVIAHCNKCGNSWKTSREWLR